MRLLIIMGVISVILPIRAHAQNHQLRQRGEFGFGGGALSYYGDLNPTINLKSHRPATNIFYRTNLKDEYLILKGSAVFGKLAADEYNLKDPYQQARGLSFSSTIAEFALNLEYNFFDFRSEKDMKIRRIHSPYIFGGISAASLSGTTESGTNSSFYTALNYGLGIKMKIAKKWNLGADFGVRYTFSDQLDGYTDEDLGDTSPKNDTYFYSGVYLSYSIFGPSCPGETGKVWIRK